MLDRLRNLMPGAQARAAAANAAERQAHMRNIADRRAEIDRQLTQPSRQAWAQAQQLGAQANQRHADAQQATTDAAQALTQAQNIDAQLQQLWQQIQQAESDAQQASVRAEQGKAHANALAENRVMDQASQVWTQAQQSASHAQQLTTWATQARAHGQQLYDAGQQLRLQAQQLTAAAAQATNDSQQLLTQAQAAQANSQTLWNQALQTQQNLATSRPDLWRFVNQDTGAQMQDSDPSSGVSGLTGTGRPPSTDLSRRYDRPGGYRRPLLSDQRALEGAMPRGRDGRFQRSPDPRGPWLRLMNGIGRGVDPTRNVNCNDATLSLFETMMHGRPRVAAPRTLDGYGQGRLTNALNGETDGPGRVEDITGGRYQAVAGDTTNLPAHQAQQVVQNAFDSVGNQLLQSGHGSFAFLITAWGSGGSHAWAAVNHHGTIIYVDAQSGEFSDTGPLYSPSLITMMDALVVGADGQPVQLQNAPRGTWSARPALPQNAAPVQPTPPVHTPPVASSRPRSRIGSRRRTGSPTRSPSGTTASPIRVPSSSSTSCTGRRVAIRRGWSVRSTVRNRAPRGGGSPSNRHWPTGSRPRRTPRRPWCRRAPS